MNSFSVKKNIIHKYFIRVFGGILSAFFVGGLYYFRFTMPQYIIMCIPFLIIIFMLWLYFEIWKIEFTSQKIYLHSLFKKASFSYSQIKNITMSRSYTDEIFVEIHFVTGLIRFRMIDENSEKAVKTLRSHHSISSNLF